MLSITFDLFSGRPNPSWSLDDDAADEVLAEIARNPGAVSGLADAPAILGFRGVELRLSEDLAQRHGLPREFRIAGGGAADEDAGRALAGRLLDTVPPESATTIERAGAGVVPDAKLVEFLREQIHATGPAPDSERRISGPGPPPAAVGPGQEEPRVFNAYRYEAFGWDPTKWNDSSHIRRNNCYCFGVDQRIDHFGLPGYAGTGTGVMPPFTTPQLEDAIRADGAVPRAHGVSASLRPRHMFAMVLGYLDPRFGYQDFHFYRELAGGVWGHKPGGTRAIQTDDAGNLIYDPHACSRPKYPEFCGYFFTQYQMRIGGNYPP